MVDRCVQHDWECWVDTERQPRVSVTLTPISYDANWILTKDLRYCSATWCKYESDLTLLWASIAFLLGSLVLWYEALDKYLITTR